MAKKASAVSNLSVNSVALESYLDGTSLKVSQEVIDVTGFVQTGPSKVVGNYDFTQNLSGQFDGASGAVDATLFGLVGNAGVATDFSPTGVAAGANDPHYTATQVLESYEISAKTGAAVTFSASLSGNSALVRAVA